MKRRLALKLYRFAYWLGGIALKMRGIDRAEFHRYWADQIVNHGEDPR